MERLSSIAAVLLLTAAPAMSFLDTKCAGKSYYPMINTTSPFENVLQKDGGLHKNQPYYSGHALFPDMKTYGCIENPNTVLSDGKRENMTALSAQYWCNANGTTLSWVEYNVSSCGGCAAGEDECIYDQKRVIGSGNRSVPFESDGFTFGCSCFGDDKFVTMHTYNASADNNGQFAMFSGSEPGANCSAKDKETRLTMSGSCSGYYDNTTKDGLSNDRQGVKRSRRITCAPNAQFVSYQEYTGLDCSGQPYFNDTFDVGTCALVRNYTRSFECESVGGTDDDASSSSNAGKSTLEDLFGVNSTDFMFLLICFLYFWFVVLVVAVGHQWATGTGCFKSKKVEADDGGEEEVIPEIPGSPEALAAEAAKIALTFDDGEYAVATATEPVPENETGANAEEYGNMAENAAAGDQADDGGGDENVAAGDQANEGEGDGNAAAGVEGEEVPVDGAGSDDAGAGDGIGEGAGESAGEGYSEEAEAGATVPVEGGEAASGAVAPEEGEGTPAPTEVMEVSTEPAETTEEASVETEVGPTTEAAAEPAAETENSGAPVAAEIPLPAADEAAPVAAEVAPAAVSEEAPPPAGDTGAEAPLEEPEVEVGAEVI